GDLAAWDRNRIGLRRHPPHEAPVVVALDDVAGGAPALSQLVGQALDGRKVGPSFDQQHRAARVLRQPRSQRGAGPAGADHDHVVGHGAPPTTGSSKQPASDRSLASARVVSKGLRSQTGFTGLFSNPSNPVNPVQNAPSTDPRWSRNQEVPLASAGAST